MKDIIKLNNDFGVDIAMAHSRMSRSWKNREWRWSDLLGKCSQVQRTGETMREYLRMSREEQSRIKDVGGFVGGYLAGGLRKTANVLYRTLVTLDIDDATADMWDDFTMSFGCAAMVYSTHKHTTEKPRLRLVLPSNRQMSPSEYEPVCRYWADKVGIEAVDPASFRLPQLMYWPSASSDGEFLFDYQDEPPFDVDEVLSSYRNPADVSEWPMGSREGEAVAHEMRKAGNPTEKPGLIGAFCRVYSIEDAIEVFLPDVYERTATEGRYTYKAGSVAGGLVTYEGKFAFSHHDTDPASRKLCNAFDLVRLHKFGIHDEGSRAADITKMPSFIMMQDFVAADSRVRVLMTKERMAGAADDFAGIEDGDAASVEAVSTDWMSALDYDKKGNLKATPKSLKTIMLNDPMFRMVRYDLFSQRDTVTDGLCPFKGTHAPDEVDDTSLARMAGYLSEMYGVELSINSMIDKMLKPTAPERAYHAVRDFITAQTWDGVPRVDTLLIDYLGADDTPLNRAIARKWMAGAVGRALDIDADTGEGIKFDYCLVLFGEQGTGKSTFAEILANRWRGAISFADARKEQYETLQRAWIVEIPEFKGMKSADTDAIKDLITSRSDNFRAAYARQWNKNPRHSVMIGSTNNEHFLKDATGNRRFWVVKVNGGPGVKSWAPKLRRDIGQIWAEAHLIYKGGEPLMLPPELEAQMRSYADSFNDYMGDPLRDYLSEWLEIRLPADWDTYEPKRRADYYRHYDVLDAKGCVERERVAIHEIVTTCPYPGISRYSTQRIAAILKSLGWEKGSRERVGKVRGKDGRIAKATMYHKLKIVSEDKI